MILLTRSKLRLHKTLADITLVYLHTVLPAEWSRDLPDVTQGWTDFWPAARDDPESRRGRREFTRFLAGLQPSSKATLHFIHNHLPHGPFLYLPSGKSYGPGGFFQNSPRMTKGKWTGGEWETLQGLQRHLLQVGFADRLLGDLITRLREAELYERSLLIVTSDHGAAFSDRVFLSPAVRQASRGYYGRSAVGKASTPKARGGTPGKRRAR